MSDNKSPVTSITLPYDFIPLPGRDIPSTSEAEPEYLYPYSGHVTGKQPPRHDRHTAGLLSGYLTYNVSAHSPLAVELRETSDEEGRTTRWMSGSTIRGKTYSNVEILSASYPAFIDDSDLLYRDIQDKAYKEKLGVTDDCKLEQAVEAGYLYRDADGSFYIIPAAPIGDYHFVTVRELDLVNGEKKMLSDRECLFKWRNNDATHQKLKDYAAEIKTLDEAVHAIRQSENMKAHPADPSIQAIFTQRFAFTKIRREKNIEQLREELREELANKINDPFLEELLDKMADRWVLKLRMHKIYQNHLFQNRYSIPYQKAVSFVAQGRSIAWIGDVSSPKAGAVKGMLFNSTNASSKRGHYLIGREREDDLRINVPDRTIAAYNAAFRRMRLDSKENEKFYDLFNTNEETTFVKPKIVFYKKEERTDHEGNVEQTLIVGRTPYFRVQHQFRMSKLRGLKQQAGIDYASSLFGYIASERQIGDDGQQDGYRSRLRFSPLRVSGNTSGRLEKFLLVKPQATAEAMYLKPHYKKPSSYEGVLDRRGANGGERIVAPRLRGRKYYHVLPSPLSLSSEVKEDNNKMLSQRYVYDPPFHLEGTIHFKNLTEAELGLLLLAMDIRLLPDAGNYHIDGKPCYELIGGAKPYGYGKVQFAIEDIQLERIDNSFESLIVQPYEKAKAAPAYYVAVFLKEQGGKAWLDRIHIKDYVRSKQEKEFSPEEQQYYVNWINMEEQRRFLNSKDKGGGYPKNWMLKDPGN